MVPRLYKAVIAAGLLFGSAACSTLYLTQGYRDSAPKSYCKTAGVRARPPLNRERIIIEDTNEKITIEPLTTWSHIFWGPILVPVIPLRLGSVKEISFRVTFELKDKNAEIDFGNWRLISNDEVASPIAFEPLAKKGSGTIRLDFYLRDILADQFVLDTGKSQLQLVRDIGGWSYIPFVVLDEPQDLSPLPCL